MAPVAQAKKIFSLLNILSLLKTRFVSDWRNYPLRSLRDRTSKGDAGCEGRGRSM